MSFYPRLNEKFTEDSDPITDMSIGLKHQIEKFIEENDEYNGVKNGDITASEFVAGIPGEPRLDDDTRKMWVEFLLREGEDINKWEEESMIEDMYNILHIDFIPNSKKLPDKNFKYQIRHGEYYLYTLDWANFIDYFSLHGDVDKGFVAAVFNGDAYDYFSYYEDSGCLDDILDSLHKDEIQKLFIFLKPICLKYSETIKDVKDINDLFHLIKMEDELEKVYKALKRAYVIIAAAVEENAAYEDLIRAIKKSYSITEVKANNENLILKTTKEALNKLFAAYWLSDNEKVRIVYYPPQGSWSGDFNFLEFIEEVQNQLEY
jgi:hypothetical protein